MGREQARRSDHESQREVEKSQQLVWLCDDALECHFYRLKTQHQECSAFNDDVAPASLAFVAIHSRFID